MKILLKSLIVLVCLAFVSTFVAAQFGGVTVNPAAMHANYANPNVAPTIDTTPIDADCELANIPSWYAVNVIGCANPFPSVCVCDPNTQQEQNDTDNDGCTNLEEYQNLINHINIPCFNLGECEDTFIDASDLCDDQNHNDYCFEDCSINLGDEQCSNNEDDDSDGGADYNPLCTSQNFKDINCDPQCDSNIDDEELPIDSVPEFSAFGIIIVLLAVVGVYVYVKRN